MKSGFLVALRSACGAELPLAPGATFGRSCPDPAIPLWQVKPFSPLVTRIPRLGARGSRSLGCTVPVVSMSKKGFDRLVISTLHGR